MDDRPRPTLGTRVAETSLLGVRSGLVCGSWSPTLSPQQAESMQEPGGLAKDNNATASHNPSTES